MNKEPFIFRHIGKLVTGIFVITFALMIGIITMGVMLVDEVQEQGLRGVVEEIWYGEAGKPESNDLQ